MDGRLIMQAWRAWLESEEGQKVSDPVTLGFAVDVRQYLENRLERAFQAGIETAEKDEATGSEKAKR